jgi:hypothetical protein
MSDLDTLSPSDPQLANIRHELANCYRGGRWRFDMLLRYKKKYWDRKAGGKMKWQTLGKLMDDIE